MYLRGSFGIESWRPIKMNRKTNGKWEVTTHVWSGNHSFKFANTPDWSGKDWGGGKGQSGLLIAGENNISMNFSGGKYKFVFDENTLQYEVIFKSLGDKDVGSIIFKVILTIAAMGLVGFVATIWDSGIGRAGLLFSAMQHPKNIFGQFGIVRSVVHPFSARCF